VEVQRYSPYGWCNLEGELHEDDKGRWVKLEDYQKLLEEVRKLRATE
jgi:hypothetical protein